MKILKTLSVTLLLSAAAVSTAVAANPLAIAAFIETPVKTVVIKNPNAEDATKFFSVNTIVHFEVYKVGTKEELATVIASLKKNADVESVHEGIVTGDYQALDIVLKTTKNKEWFSKSLKNAGLNHIKINNNPIIPIENL